MIRKSFLAKLSALLYNKIKNSDCVSEVGPNGERAGETVKIREKQFLIKDQSLDKVKLTIQEFQNKYQNYKSRWDFELLSQNDNHVTAHIVDHSYETPRAKGQSDSPTYEIQMESVGEDVRLSWYVHWKRSKRNFSWLTLWLLVVSRVLIFLTIHGDRLVLFMGIWAFWTILYAGWLFQNYMHDRARQDIFLEILRLNFSDQVKKAPAAEEDPSVNEKE